jgi:hypothetical protein
MVDRGEVVLIQRGAPVSPDALRIEREVGQRRGR